MIVEFSERDYLDLVEIAALWATYKSERFYSGYGYTVNERDFELIVKILSKLQNDT